MATIEVRLSVKHKIRAIRDGKVKTEDGGKMSAREKIHQVAKLVAYDLQQFGCFYYEEEGRPFYFEYETKKLIDLSCENIDSMIFLRRYGINGADTIHQYVMRELIEDIYIYGTRTTVYQLAHYDHHRATLYVYNEVSVERITADNISTVPNGTDGVLFLRTPGAVPWIRGEETDPEEPLMDTLMWNTIPLVEDEMTATQRRKLLNGWFYAIFFESVILTRPILAFIGPKGSGKTFTLQLVGKLLFGDSFDVSPIPTDEKEFDVIASNSPLFAIDNADTKCKWLEDRLAIASTGGKRKCKVLYTTNRMAEISIRSWIAITSRAPHFRRDDVADRLLIMAVEKRPFDKTQYETISTLKANRDALMSEICYDLQKIVAAQQLTLDTAVGFRMSDFASFMFKIGKSVDLEMWFRTAFGKLFTEQSKMAVELDPVVDLLRGWIDDHDGQEVPAKTIYDAIKAKAESEKIDFWFKNTVSFGLKLSNIRANLEEWYTITKRKGRVGHTLWSFTKKENTAEGSVEVDPTLGLTISKEA